MEKLPKHIAIIMDGNGRWAKKRLKNRIFGHKQGIKVVRDIVEYSAKRGIKYLTLYTFSSENWQRPKVEVSTLMSLLEEYLTKEADWLVEIGVRVNVIGDLSKLPEDVQTAIKHVKEKTLTSNKMVLNLALSYGGRDEILRAVKKIVENKTKPEQIDEKYFQSFLDTKDQPDPDLLIRTSGEYRTSNFLLWQTAYTEFYFTKTLWPDFTIEEFEAAIQDYSRRDRRFGKV